MSRMLGELHHRVARRLTGRQPRIGRDSEWVYPPMVEAMAESGLQEVETYLFFHENTVTNFIVKRPITDLYLAAERRPGSRMPKR